MCTISLIWGAILKVALCSLTSERRCNFLEWTCIYYYSHVLTSNIVPLSTIVTSFLICDSNWTCVKRDLISNIIRNPLLKGDSRGLTMKLPGCSIDKLHLDSWRTKYIICYFKKWIQICSASQCLITSVLKGHSVQSRFWLQKKIHFHWSTTQEHMCSYMHD